ncbi:hypothetical protein [Aquimarina sp. 2201CG5-10]|uniref:hypothetical protein n=1 Tax=Aquimarina callyspongiae TaxID=3098150 RepID=UPI002AB47623|nr:hypothetical protein [Aquimarina sp. 2201CG5-10]MDY8136082.1 hypothetical protein [Aquimarina sp. 2201CG5-10]
MSVDKKHISKLIKLENNGELKRILGDCELHPDAFEILEKHLNLEAQTLIRYSVDQAKKRSDKTIVNSHSIEAIGESELRRKSNKNTPFLEIIKIFGTIGITACLTHIIQSSQSENSDINVFVVVLGVFGGLLLGTGLFYKKK